MKRSNKKQLESLVKAYQKYGGGSPEHLKALARYELKAYGTIINGKLKA